MRFRVNPSVKRYTSQSSDFQLWTNQRTEMFIPGRPKIAGEKYPGLMATSCRLLQKGPSLACVTCDNRSANNGLGEHDDLLLLL